MENAPSPVSGADQPRCAPSVASTHTAVTTNTTSTASSIASTTKPATAAVRTPRRFSSVVTTTASAVHTHWCTDGTSACMAMPEKRYATAGISR